MTEAPELRTHLTPSELCYVAENLDLDQSIPQIQDPAVCQARGKGPAQTQAEVADKNRCWAATAHMASADDRYPLTTDLLTRWQLPPEARTVLGTPPPDPSARWVWVWVWVCVGVIAGLHVSRLCTQSHDAPRPVGAYS